MYSRYLKHKWQRIAAISFSAIVIIIAAASFLLNRYFSPILSARVKELVIKSTDSLYHINFSSAELHVIAGSIILNNVSLKLDTAIYNKKLKQHLAPNNLIDVKLKRLTLLHVHPYKLYFKREIDIYRLVINDPVINITYQLNHTKDSVTDNRTPWQKISKVLRSVHVKTILLNDIKFRYEDLSGIKVVISEFKELNLSANEFLLDSASQTNHNNVFFCRDIIAELSNYSGKAPNGLYNYKITSLKLSTLQSRLDIKGISVIPAVTLSFFKKSQGDRFNVHLDSIELNHFDFLNFQKYRVLKASSLLLSQGSVEVSGNPDNRKKDQNRINSFPAAALQNIKNDIKIDSVLIRHLNIFYTETGKKSGEQGQVAFNNTSGKILNITNNKAALLRNNLTSASFTTYFMTRGKMDVNFQFNLTDSLRSFTFKGAMGAMPLQKMNPAVTPLAMIKVTAGTLKSFDFNFVADRKSAKGSVKILYNDLKVNVLKMDTVKDKLSNMLVQSLYANIFIIRHDNPDKDGVAPRTFNVDYPRKDDVPFFKFIWQSLLTGLKPSFGLDKKTELTARFMQKQQIIKKQTRKTKKAERKRKREEKRKLKALKEEN